MTDENKLRESDEGARLKELSEKLIPDEKLRSLLVDQPDKVCELIVEAVLPKRLFKFRDPKSKKLTIEKSNVDPGSEDRDAILDRLTAELQELLGNDNVNALKTSGAIVVRGAAKQLSQILKLKDVKAIRENRRLPRINPQSR